MRFLVRALGMIVLAVAVVFATGDIARSIADENRELISVREAFQATGIGFDPSAFGDPTVATFLTGVGGWPMALTFGVLGIALIALGRRAQARSRARRAL